MVARSVTRRCTKVAAIVIMGVIMWVAYAVYQASWRPYQLVRPYLCTYGGICLVDGHQATTYIPVSRSGDPIERFFEPFVVQSRRLLYWSEDDRSIAMIDANGHIQWHRLPDSLSSPGMQIASVEGGPSFALLNVCNEHREPIGVLKLDLDTGRWAKLTRAMEARADSSSDAVAVLTAGRKLLAGPINKSTKWRYITELPKCLAWDYDFNGGAVCCLLTEQSVAIRQPRGKLRKSRIPGRYTGAAVVWNAGRNELWVAISGVFGLSGIAVYLGDGRLLGSFENGLGTFDAYPVPDHARELLSTSTLPVVKTALGGSEDH